MSAIPIRIADAVTADINGHAFAIGAFTASRSYPDWNDDYKGLDTMAVDVVYTSASVKVRLNSRGYLIYDVPVDIVVRKRFVTSDRNTATGRLLNASIDPLATLLEDIHEFFLAKRNGIVLSTEITANWNESDVKSWVNQRKLRTAGLFEGVVRITFSIRKAI